MNMPSNILQLAIDIEIKSRDIYVNFARMFNHVHKISEFWKKLMKDENVHANILEDISAKLREEGQEINTDSRIINNIQATNEYLMTDLMSTIHNLNDAYDLSHNLETREVEMLFDMLSTDFGKHVEALRIVMLEEQGHLQRILDFSQIYGNAEWRKSIKAQ